jgi:hypothetical protein
VSAHDLIAPQFPGLIGLFGQGVDNDRGREIEAVAGQSMGLGQLPNDERADARRRQLQQPPDVLGRDEVPGWSEHMGADHVPLVEQGREFTRVRVWRATGDRPSGLARVLGLDGEQGPDHRGRGPGVRSHEVLSA